MLVEKLNWFISNEVVMEQIQCSNCHRTIFGYPCVHCGYDGDVSVGKEDWTRNHKTFSNSKINKFHGKVI